MVGLPRSSAKVGRALAEQHMFGGRPDDEHALVFALRIQRLHEESGRTAAVAVGRALKVLTIAEGDTQLPPLGSRTPTPPPAPLPPRAGSLTEWIVLSSVNGISTALVEDVGFDVNSRWPVLAVNSVVKPLRV